MQQLKSSLRAGIAVSLVAVVVASVGGLLYWSYHTDRKDYLVKQRETMLLTIATRLPSAIAVAEEAGRTALGTVCQQGLGTAGMCDHVGALPAGVSCVTSPTKPVPSESPLERRVEMPCHDARMPAYLRVDVEAILRSLIDEEGINDYLLLTKPSGEVLWQRWEGHSGVTDVTDLITNRRQREASALGKEPRPTPAALVPGNVEDVDFDGEPQRLFVAAVKLDATTSWYALCSLSRNAELDTAALGVPRLWLLWLASIVILVGLAWPLLKLRYVGPHERLKAIDVLVLAMCAVLATALVTAVLLIRNFHDRTLLARDRGLARLAHTASARLLDEIRDAGGVLGSIDAKGGPARAGGHDDADILLLNGRGEPVAAWAIEPTLLGRELGWTAKSVAKPKARFDKRNYFGDVRHERFWSIERDAPSGHPLRVAIEPVRSLLDARLRLVVAAPVSTNDRTQEPAVAVIGITPRAFADPIRPPGIELMLIDDRGSMKLHSLSTRSLRGNLFVDCEQNPHLQAAVRSRRAQLLDATCSGERRRIYVEPFAGTLWSMIVTADPDRPEALVVEMAATWSVLFAFHFFALVLVAMVVWLVRRRYRAPWLWPDRSRSGRYVLASLQLLTTAAVVIWMVRLASGLHVAALLLLVPAAASAMLCLTLGTPTSPIERRVAVVVAVAGLVTSVTIAVTALHGQATLVLLALVAFWCVGHLGRWTGLSGLDPAVGVGAPAMIALTMGGGPHWAVAGIAVAASAGVTTPLAPARVRRWLAGERGFRASYTTMALALLCLVAAVPSAVFMRDARQYVQTAFAKLTRLELARSLLARAERLDARAMGIAATRASGLQDPLLRWMLNASEDVYDESWPVTGLPPDTRVTRDDPWHCTNAESSCGSGTTRNLLSNWILSLLPTSDALASDLRRSTCHGATDARWCWTQRNDGPITIQLSDERSRRFLANDEQIAPSRGTSPRGWHDPTGHRAERIGARFMLLGILLTAGAWGLLYSISRRVFVLEVDAGGTTDVATGAGVRRVVVYRSAPDVARSETVALDLATADGPQTIRDFEPGNAPAVVLHHLDAALANPKASDATLALVRGLLKRDVDVVLTSEADPSSQLVMPTGTSASDAARRARVEGWTAILTRFTRTFVPLDGAPDGWLRAHYDGPMHDGTRAAVDDDHGLQARNRHIWNTCSLDEQIALRQLADEGFLNPNNLDIERGLFRRGLIRRAPAFTLLDDGFRRFIRRTMSAAEARSHELEGTDSAWARLRGPLVILLGVVVTFFVVTQRAAFDSALGTATAVTASLPVILRLVGIFKESKAGAAPKG